jgi:hypothetical protein
LFKTLPGEEDYAWTPEGDALMGKGMMLYSRRLAGEDEWKLTADFSNLDGSRITRLAVSSQGDRLAMVVVR